MAEFTGLDDTNSTVTSRALHVLAASGIDRGSGFGGPRLASVTGTFRQGITGSSDLSKYEPVTRAAESAMQIPARTGARI
jgi:hypothetical protein